MGGKPSRKPNLSFSYIFLSSPFTFSCKQLCFSLISVPWQASRLAMDSTGNSRGADSCGDDHAMYYFDDEHNCASASSRLYNDDGVIIDEWWSIATADDAATVLLLRQRHTNCYSNTLLLLAAMWTYEYDEIFSFLSRLWISSLINSVLLFGFIFNRRSNKPLHIYYLPLKIPAT